MGGGRITDAGDNRKCEQKCERIDLLMSPPFLFPDKISTAETPRRGEEKSEKRNEPQMHADERRSEKRLVSVHPCNQWLKLFKGFNFQCSFNVRLKFPWRC
jgi:hypothetical protein